MAGYLGNNPSDSSVRIARQIYTTSGVTTDFTFTSGYDPGYIDVYVNGERQTEGTNFTANDGSTVIILNGGVSTGSTVECAAYKTFNVATVTLGEVTDVDDLVITGKITAGSGDIGIATIHSSGIDAGVGVITAASYVGDGSSLTGIASTDIINAEQVNVSGSTTTGIATVSTSVVVGSAVTVTATAININPTVTTTIGDSGNVDFNDDAKARFGTGNDLSIYHSGAHSFINDSGTGNLKILSSQVDILNPASNETIATFAENGAVSLYYDNSVKLATNTDGIDISDKIVHTGDTDTAIRFPAADTITAETAGSERFRITSAGKVGIGTDSPQEELTIMSATPALMLRDTDQGGSYTQVSNANQDMYFSANGAAAHANFIFRSGNNGSFSERARIDSSGRLLIGTTTEGNASADDITIATTGDTGITIRSGTTSTGYIMFSDATSGNGEYAGYLEYAHNTNQFQFYTNGGSLALTLNSSQNATFAGTVADSKGNVRSIIQNTQGSTYTLVAGDAGKHILASGTVTIPNSVFSAGDAVTIVNNTAGDLTLTASVGTLYNTADASTGDRTLATRGMATILFSSATAAYISGAGLS